MDTGGYALQPLEENTRYCKKELGTAMPRWATQWITGRVAHPRSHKHVGAADKMRGHEPPPPTGTEVHRLEPESVTLAGTTHPSHSLTDASKTPLGSCVYCWHWHPQADKEHGRMRTQGILMGSWDSPRARQGTRCSRSAIQPEGLPCAPPTSHIGARGCQPRACKRRLLSEHALRNASLCAWEMNATSCWNSSCVTWTS
jgi:hypothetical protein